MPMYVRRMRWWFAMLLAFGAAPAQGGDDGENFVTPQLPDASAWVLAPDPNRPTARLWKNKQNDKDAFRIEVIRGPGEALPSVRMTLDAPGKANCASFDTTTIRESPAHGYPRLLWRTDCVRADSARSTLLTLAIRGRDGLYLAIKSWQFEVGEPEVEAWTDRLERAFVCDTRMQSHPCSEGGTVDDG